MFNIKFINEQIQIFFGDRINEIAKETNFINRKRIITPKDFFITVLINCFGLNSFLTLSGIQQTYLEKSKKISESALCQRFTAQCVEFFKAILGETIKKLTTEKIFCLN
jgi:hypothetical protein